MRNVGTNAAWTILAGLPLVVGPARAQTEEEAAKPAVEDAAKPAVEEADKPGAKPPGTLTGKKLACRESGTKNGLKGGDLQDHVSLCIEEARLACLKDAIAQKVRGKERKEFMTKCMDTAG